MGSYQPGFILEKPAFSLSIKVVNIQLLLQNSHYSFGASINVNNEDIGAEDVEVSSVLHSLYVACCENVCVSSG